MKRLLFLLSLLSALHFSAHAQQSYDLFAVQDSGSTDVMLLSEQNAVSPGKAVTLAIQLKHPEGFHSYYKNPGGPGLPLGFEWQLPEGYSLKKLHWPTPHLYDSKGTSFYVYEGNYTILADISVPDSAPLDQEVEFKVIATWQLCNPQTCLQPESRESSIKLPIRAVFENSPEHIDLFKKTRANIPKPSNTWQVTAKVNNGKIVLHLQTNDGSVGILGDAHFIPDSPITDPTAPQDLIDTGEFYILSAPLAEGVDLGTRLKGIIAKPGKPGFSFDIEAPTNQAKKTATASGSSKALVTLDGKEEKKLNIFSAIGFAFLGGMILNLMPCVFPVLGIKIMGFVQQAGEDPRKIKIHGMVFAAGLLISLWILAAVLIALITVGGRTLGWGFQLNNPVFLAAMIMLLFFLALNLTGVFEIGTSLTGVGGELQAKKGYKGSFFSGILTTLIATPCTGPFLGTTMGYTLQQSPLVAMVIFTALGLGISSPYVILSFFPSLINKLPRPGAWMETFKQVMAFPLYATVIFFLNGFGNLKGTSGLIWLLTALLILTIAMWIYGRWFSPMKSKRARTLSILFTLVFLSFTFVTTKHALSQKSTTPEITSQDDDLFQWEEWRPGIVAELQDKGHIVFMDYTADT